VLLPPVCACRTTTKTSLDFTSFQIVYGSEAVFPIECEIPSLKLAVELLRAISTAEEHFLHLPHLDETRFEVALASEAHKK